MDQHIREDARLVILKALALQVDETLNSGMLCEELARMGISRERAWVHVELDWLAEMGAVRVLAAGDVRIATLTERGARHVSRATSIEGIKRPGRPEA